MLTRKQQMLIGVEGAEGVAATLTATDAVRVYDPAITDGAERSERVLASASLGRQNDQPISFMRQVTFGSELYGGLGSAPDWAKLIRAAGYTQVRTQSYALTSISGPFQLGEKVYLSGSEDTEYGIALNTTAASGSDTLYVLWLVGSAGSGTVTGKSSSATGTAAGGASNDEWGFHPESEKRVTITTTSTWSGGPTIAAGVVLLVTRGGLVVGSVRAISDNGSTWEDFNGAVQFGNVQDGDILISPAAETATVDGDPDAAALLVPSLTQWHNIDGFQRRLRGSRGTFEISGDSGQPLRLQWTFDGVEDSHYDTPLVSLTAALPTTLPPKMVAAQCVIGIGSQSIVVPLRSIGVNAGNQLTPRPDANQAGAYHHVDIADRVPTISLGTDRVGKAALDWEGLKSGGGSVRFGLRYGTTSGNKIVIAAPQCQVISAVDSDQSGIGGLDVTLNPRFLLDGTVLEEGDNELVIAITA